MGVWDFVKDAGKSVFGGAAEAAEAKPAPAAADKPQYDAETQAKVDALTKELAALKLSGKDIKVKLQGDKVTLSGNVKDAETAEKLILAIGNIKGIAKVETDGLDYPEAQTATPVFYTVEKGDTLSAIAKKTLGSANRYHAIFEANKPMLSDPDKIYPGQTLRIPQD